MVALLRLVLVASWLGSFVDGSIPRSHSHFALRDDDGLRRPAWNPSPKINSQGYLCDLYRRIPGEWEAECPYMGTSDTSEELDVPVCIRQVPGDGDCLFHAVAMSLSLIQGRRHSRMDTAASLRELKNTSRKLRQMAVECLREKKKQRSRKHTELFIQGCESMTTTELLSTAAAQYGISGDEYCNLMQQDSYWGGGPEIVALCHILKRPIHVYELVGAEDNTRSDGTEQSVHNNVRVPLYLMNEEFRLRRMACFGSPKFDRREPLRILSADSRFPDVGPHCITENGNHFMALFPVDLMRRWANCCEDRHKFNSEKKRRVRGGAASDAESGDDVTSILNASEDSWLLHGEWHNDLAYSDHLKGENWVDDNQRSSKLPCWWRRKRGDRLGKERRQLAVAKPGQPVKRIVGFWINAFIWTLSHFHFGLSARR